MKKALKTGIAIAAAAALFAGYAAVNLQFQPEACPVAEVYEAAVLKQGSRGGEVKEVQRRLKNWGYYSGEVDGVYGSATEAAVKYFQRKNGLSVDAIVSFINSAAKRSALRAPILTSKCLPCSRVCGSVWALRPVLS